MRAALGAPGQPFEQVDRLIGGVPIKVYKNLPVNLSHYIAQAVAFSDRTFMVSGERRLSFGEVLGQAAGLASVLRQEYGVGKGVRVAIAMRNSPEWVLSFLAILLAEGTGVYVNSRGSGDEILYALTDTECSLLIADAIRAEKVAETFNSPIIIANEIGGFHQYKGKPLMITSASVQPSVAESEDPAYILFTSGTTGRPKGAVSSHRAVASFLMGTRHNATPYLIRKARQMGVDPAQLAAAMPIPSLLLAVPLFHVGGISVIMNALMGGGKIVFMRKWIPAEALACIAREKITMLSGPPILFWDILRDPAFPRSDVSTLSSIGMGGQATPPNLRDRILKALPNVSMGTGYGSTEVNGAVTTSSGEEWLVNPIGAGRVLPGVEIEIRDEQGNVLPVGAPGEIWVRSALNMSGYWNKPKENAAMYRDGFMRMGDIGYLDENRFMVVCDRKTDMVIRGGENIYCAELERVFQEYPGVHEIAAFGVPDERWGDRVVLAVVPLKGVKVEIEELLAFGRDRLADYKIPSEVVCCAEPFARNDTGKINKTILRQRYLASKGLDIHHTIQQ